MLNFILTLIFLPIICIVLIVASPFVFLIMGISVVILIALWVGQMIAIICGVLLIAGLFAKWYQQRLQNERQDDHAHPRH